MTKKSKVVIDRHENLGPLHDLLLRVTVPEPIGNKKSMTVLARALDITPWGIYLWIRKNKVPPIRAKQMCDLHAEYAKKMRLPEEERVSLREFDEYVYA